jgi:hypothetical protein
MTDRELLELAAKAAGMTIDTHYVDGGASVWEGERHHSDWIPDWNPLNDDGDALRLAVKFGFCVNIKERCVVAGNSPKNDWQQPLGDDPLAATRRAIVKAAAEIGRNMK